MSESGKMETYDSPLYSDQNECLISAKLYDHKKEFPGFIHIICMLMVYYKDKKAIFTQSLEINADLKI